MRKIGSRLPPVPFVPTVPLTNRYSAGVPFSLRGAAPSSGVSYPGGGVGGSGGAAENCLKTGRIRLPCNRRELKGLSQWSLPQ